MKGIQHHLILIIGLILWGFLPVTISNAVFYLAVVIVSVCIGRARSGIPIWTMTGFGSGIRGIEAANREWARFLYQARSPLAKGPFQQELKDRNIQNYQKLKEQLIGLGKGDIKIVQPFEMLFSLIIGPSENYCRAWLSGRVKTSPQEYRKEFAESAWRSLKR